jgi:predicted ArsR family transcriptional regulator
MSTQPTSVAALKQTVADGEDVSLRRQVAAALAERPQTTNELCDALPEHSANAIRPRVNELVRMGCVERDGTRENPSGHAAYVHHLTDTGRAYLDGECDPDPDPPLSEYRKRVVEVARQVTRADVDREVLDIAIEQHDKARQRADPEWSPDG